MNKKVLAAALGAALLTGCASDGADGKLIQVYYPSADGTGELETAPLENTGRDDMVDTLYASLCDPPDNTEAVSAIPAGAVLQSWSIEDGILNLDLSGEYGTLTGVEQTVANYCIVLTMCQLENVDAVNITADGESISGEAAMSPTQVMLSGGEGDTGTVDARLYFPTADGQIGYEDRELNVSENRSIAETMLEALCSGPESDELEEFLPPNAEGITIWTDLGICYVNLTEDWEDQLESGNLQQTLLCITNTLSGLDTVDSVQFVMDGAEMEQWSSFGGDFPITPDTDGCIAAE